MARDWIVGEVRRLAHEKIPAGWLLCDGSAISKEQFSELYNAVGERWNTGGEPAGTFRVPPAGKFSVSWDPGIVDFNAVGNIGGTKTATMPSHTHPGSSLTGTPSAGTLALTGAPSFSDPGHPHVLGREVVSLSPGGTGYSIVGSQSTHDAGVDSHSTGITTGTGTLAVTGAPGVGTLAVNITTVSGTGDNCPPFNVYADIICYTADM